jgi:hypothetical protein
MLSTQDYHANKKSIGRGIAIASLAWTLQPVANAQSDAEILEAVRACQRVPELSSRQACYDRAVPPIVEPAQNVPAPTVESLDEAPAPIVEPVDIDDAPTPPPERVAIVEEPESLPTMLRIVEVQMPSVVTTRFLAADGRMFVRANAHTIHRWPDAPFDVEIQVSTFGATYLKFPESGLRVRVAVDD